MNLLTITRPWLAGWAFVLTACNSAQMNFERMSFPELVAYNRTVEPMDQIYCVEEIRAGSHIRRRHCETLIEIRRVWRDQPRLLMSSAPCKFIRP